MSNSRRVWITLLVLGVMAIVSFWQRTLAQQPVAAKKVVPAQFGQGIAPGGAPNGASPEPAKSEFSDAITLSKDPDTKKHIERAEDLIKEQDWGKAVTRLQALLDRAEDFFVQVKRTDKDGAERLQWTSIRAEANRLLGALPPEGLQFYELQYGQQARLRLAEAKQNNDAQLLAEVAQRYLHTEAGAEATTLLGTYHLDRGRPFMAALCFERLLERVDSAKVPPLSLLKAALAFHRVGDQANTEKCWSLLSARTGRDGLRLGDQLVRLDDLRTELTKVAPVAVNPFDWAMFRGDASRTNRGQGDAPFLEAVWRWPTIAEQPPSSFEPENYPEVRKWVTEVLHDAVHKVEQRQQPVLPALFPIAAAGRLVYRGFEGIHARNLKTGALEWFSPSAGSLAALYARKNDDRDRLVQSLREYWLNYGPENMVFENSTIGMLSTDNSRVYAVDDLAVPPHPQYLQQANAQGGATMMGDALNQSSLQAFDLVTGKLVWAHPDPRVPASEFKGCFFLGAPLPLGGKVYALIEKKADLQLVCFDAMSGAVSWSQTLAAFKDRLPMDVARRMHTAQLSYGEGMLICPTNAGAVLGVDLLTHSLVWAHSYREAAPANTSEVPQPPMIGRGGRPFRSMPPQQVTPSEWKVSAPVVRDGKVVFTAPDALSVHCLNLRDGQLLWRCSRGDNVYLAGVFNGKVLLIGRKSCQALSLEDGRQLWQLDTGSPSGQGVASGSLYYLPLRASAETKEPEVCAIDVDKGTVVHARSRHKEVPGNLLFYEGLVISQSLNEVAAYPQLQVKLNQIDLALARNPRDPVGLMERGELRLDKGEFDSALADLRAARDSHPPDEVRPKLRGKLFETLSELLRDKFIANERFLAEFQELCRIDTKSDATPEERHEAEKEQRRRMANYYCLLGKGRAEQGRLVDAFKAYIDLGALADDATLLSVTQEPHVKARPSVLARGRIAALLSSATSDQRRPLEDMIAKEWQAARSSAHLDSLVRFVALFGTLSTVGREARLELAERLMARGAGDDYLTAELHLQQLLHNETDRVLAGQSLEALARLRTKWGLLPDAARCYNQLGSDFADVVIRDGKTGADFFNELATDKRFLPYLEGTRLPWSAGSVKARPEPIRGAFQMVNEYAVELVGEAEPYFQRHRLSVLDEKAARLRVVDRLTNEEVWRSPNLLNAEVFKQYVAPVGVAQMRAQAAPSGNPATRLLSYVRGHLILLHLGHIVYALDPIAQRLLWERNLLGEDVSPVISNSQRGSRVLQGRVLQATGTALPIGQVGPVQDNYICLLTREGLVSLDPISGRVLWTKSDVTPRGRVFGDAEHVYLVDMEENSIPRGTRAFRAADGAAVTIKDFARLYPTSADPQNGGKRGRLRTVGRTLILAESGLFPGQQIVRQYDVQTGQTLWSQAVSGRAIVATSDDPTMLGIVDPHDGSVRIIDLVRHKQVIKTALRDPAHAEKLEGVHLLQDQDAFYLALNGAANQQGGGVNSTYPNVSRGLHSVPVNGYVYAFERASGKFRWHSADRIENQMLIVDEFQDLPILLFASRTLRALPNAAGLRNIGPTQFASVKSMSKRSGKLLFNWEAQNVVQDFFALTLDIRAGTIELVATGLKIQHYIETPAVTKPSTGRDVPARSS